jgi:hypothetical protein
MRMLRVSFALVLGHTMYHVPLWLYVILLFLAYLVPYMFCCLVFFGSVVCGAVLGMPQRFFDAIAFGCMRDFVPSETIIK